MASSRFQQCAKHKLQRTAASLPYLGFQIQRTRILVQKRRLSTPSDSQTAPDTSKRGQKERSRHATWYTDTLPHMVPIALLGFIIYGTLEITRTYLARERRGVEHLKRIAELEQEILSYRERLRIAPTTTQESSSDVLETSDTQKSRWWPFW